MTTISAIPFAIDALIATFTAAGITALDGQGVTGDPLPAFVSVGVSDADGTTLQSAAVSDQEWAGFPARQRDETLEIFCLASVWSGDDDQKSVRDQAFALVKAASDAITTDPSLGGAVLFVRGINGITLEQIRARDGARADIRFTITCRARLS